MSKKIYRYWICRIILLQVLFFWFVVDGMSTVKKLPAVAPVKYSSKSFTPQSQALIKKQLAIGSNFIQQLPLDSISEAKDQFTTRKGEYEVYVYDKNTEKGYIFEKNDVEFFPVLKLSLGNDNTSIVYPVSSSAQTIQNLLGLVRDYKKCLDSSSEKTGKTLFVDCNKNLANTLNAFNFSDLLSIFLLADSLGVTHGNTDYPDVPDIFGVLSQAIQHALISDLPIFNIEEREFDLLKNFIPNTVEPIITDKVWENGFIKKMTTSIAWYCFNLKFRSHARSYQADLKAPQIKKLFLNADGSCLLYTDLPKEEQVWNYLFALDLKTGNHLYAMPKAIYFSPSWLSNNIIAYIERDEKRKKNKLELYDVVKKVTQSGATINPSNAQQQSSDFDILEMIGFSHQKMAFLYHIQYNYGIGLLDYEKQSIRYNNFSLGQSIHLLSITDKHILFLDYEKELSFVTLYKVSIEGNFNQEPFSIGAKYIPVDIKDAFLSGVVNHDSSCMAFSAAEGVFIQSLTNFNDEPFACRDVAGVLSVAFSPDNTMLMVGCNDGKIVACDVATGKKIGELLSDNKKAFNKNNSVAFSADGTKFAVAGDNEADHDALLVMELQLDAKKIQDNYLNLVNKFKEYSFDKIMLLRLLHDKSDAGKKPAILSDAEKKLFLQLKPIIQDMLINIGYVAPAQVSLLARQNKSVGQSPEENPMAVQESFVQKIWNAGGYYVDLLMKYLPGSG